MFFEIIDSGAAYKEMTQEEKLMWTTLFEKDIELTRKEKAKSQN